MSFITLKNFKFSPVLIEFESKQLIKTIKTQISPKGIENLDDIVFYYNDKKLNENTSFEENNINPGSLIIFLIKNEPKSEKIIQMLEMNIPYQKCLTCLTKTKFDVNEALKLVNEDDISDCSSFDEEESISHDSTPVLENNKYFKDESNDYAEEMLSDYFKSSESVL